MPSIATRRLPLARRRTGPDPCQSFDKRCQAGNDPKPETIRSHTVANSEPPHQNGSASGHVSSHRIACPLGAKHSPACVVTQACMSIGSKAFTCLRKHTPPPDPRPRACGQLWTRSKIPPWTLPGERQQQGEAPKSEAHKSAPKPPRTSSEDTPPSEAIARRRPASLCKETVALRCC